jgi:glyoxylase-like metal-dependent hydrolase (beta-lactamase superfamily II)
VPSVAACAPALLIRLLAVVLACAGPLRAAALEPVEVAPHVYAFLGVPGEIGPDNGGNVANSGFIVGEQGVVVIDTGISYRYGRAMLDAIARVSHKPVALVIVTHAVQEFLFGNAAFAERGVPLLAHTQTVELMRSRCDHCLANLRAILGEEAMAGTRLVVPQRTVSGTTTLTAGGRTLELLHFGWASTPGDLAVLDRASGVLFAGGLVCNGRIPELRDGQLPGWLGALDGLEALPAGRIVPGYGPLSDKRGIEQMRRYLLDLDKQVRALYRSGSSLLEALDRADLPAYAGWSMYPGNHRRNVQQRYLQLELDELGG